ncbi:ion channel [Oceanobacter mangrovi]|uniref:ion channel n=1 Tax=Oceanobacter mangrovi TaxID=2862510 RepID=UPI001C8CF95A|nr:ion channel [Oceanobacter mangrovi]
MQYGFARLIGLAGVDPAENHRARRLGYWFEWPMLMLACMTIAEWTVQETDASSKTLLSDVIIWCFFLIETLVVTFTVDHKARYLSGNWMNLLILLGGVSFWWVDAPDLAGLRTLRLLAVGAILLNISGAFERLLQRHYLGSALAVSFLIVVLFGSLMSVIDPAIHSPLDGIWWAWVTVTTVGYGDLVPTSSLGRVVAGLLILMGIGLVALLTASMSSLFVQQDEESQNRRLQRQSEQITALQQQVNQLEDKIDQLLQQSGIDHNQRDRGPD